MLRKIKGFIFVTLVFLSSFLGSVFMMGPVLPLLLISPTSFRKTMDELVGSWESYPVSILEILFGMKVKIFGDHIQPGENCLILMNHRTRLDWVWFWSCLYRYGSMRDEKIILKEGLKFIPGAGWAMQNGAYIFIKRQWEHDKTFMGKFLNYLKETRAKTQVLLFPEGTDLTANTKSKSDSFALKNDLKCYEYVLHPRTTGFSYIAEHMRKIEMLDAVYDVSIAYPTNVPQTEKDLANGNVPQEVHFHIKRHHVATMPINEQGLTNWLETLWRKKEESLETFYKEQSFSESELLKFDENVFKRCCYFQFSFWTSSTIFMIILLICSPIAQWYFFVTAMFYFLLGRFGGGVDGLALNVYNWLFHRKMNKVD